jgi:hypothetical protein
VFLRAATNTVLHGSVSPEAVAAGLRDMDAVVLCFDIERDPSHGANYHKVLEYLSAGRVIISSFVSAYAQRDDLVRMAREPGNQDFLAIFDDTVRNLSTHNSPAARDARINFAVEHSYRRQLDRVEQLLKEND